MHTHKRRHKKVNPADLPLQVIRNFTVVEKGMVSAERIDEYTHGIENEVSRIPGQVPDSNWPSQGVLEFRDVVMRYRDDLPPALKGVSFKTAPREKLGVVGRTGAGKSSLAVAIWRMTEISEGCILLDGVDTRIMGTCDLRERLSIIPQDPIIFSGTVRTNVDPLGVYSDKQVWDALERVQFKSFMTAAVARGCHGDKEGGHDDAEGLHMAIQSGGVNLSAGQRQLLCLARGEYGTFHTDKRPGMLLTNHKNSTCTDNSLHRPLGRKTVLT